MKNKDFEQEYKKLILNTQLSEIIELFQKKEKSYNATKFEFFHTIVKKIFRKKDFNFLKLGYSIYDSLNLTSNLVSLALDNNRVDVIEYFILNKIIDKMSLGFYLGNTVKSEYVLESILKSNDIQKKLTTSDIEQMVNACAVKNKPKSFDIIMKFNKFEVEKINKKRIEEILLVAGNCNANDFIINVLNKNSGLKVDVNFNHDDYGIMQDRSNLTILAAKNNNLDLLDFLISSKDLEKNVDLSESVFWIMDLKNSRKIIEHIIFDLNYKFDDSFFNLIRKKDNHKAIELLTILETRDLKNLLNENINNKVEKKNIIKI